MRHDQKSLLELSPQVKKQLMQLLRIRRIQVARRLIGKNNIRVIDQRPRHRHPLLLPAG